MFAKGRSMRSKATVVLPCICCQLADARTWLIVYNHWSCVCILVNPSYRNVSNYFMFIWHTLIFLSFKISGTGKFHCSSQFFSALSLLPESFLWVEGSSYVALNVNHCIIPMVSISFSISEASVTFHSHYPFVVTNSSSSQSTLGVFIQKLFSSLIISFKIFVASGHGAQYFHFSDSLKCLSGWLYKLM